MALDSKQEKWVADKMQAEADYNTALTAYKSVMANYTAEIVAAEKAFADAKAAIEVKYKTDVEAKRKTLETTRDSLNVIATAEVV